MMHKENIADIYPLSPLQKGMLFHSLYAPESGGYIEQRLCTLRGNIHTDIFLKAWQSLVDRHPILRSVFVWENLAEPHQVVLKSVQLDLNVEDWTGVPVAEQTQKLTAFLQADRIKGFALNRPPLMRLSLIKKSADLYAFVWSFHHLLLDGWSLSMVLQEMVQFMQAYEQGKSLELPSPPPYRDYIAWTRKQNMEVAADYWRNALAGYQKPTPLPLINESHKWMETEDAYEELHEELTEAESSYLLDFTRKNQLSINHVLQAAWALLLSRYSGEREVIFGTLLSGRPVGLAGSDRMIGLFTNLLPFRMDVDPEKPVLEWLQEIRERGFELIQYEHSPLIDIHQWTGIPHGKSMFDTFLSFENFPWRTLTKEANLTPVDGILRAQASELEILDVEYIERTNFPLCMMVVPGPRLKMRMPYDRSLYSEGAARQLAGHYRHLILQLIGHPEQRLGQLGLLLPEEWQLQMEGWNATDFPLPWDKCIHELLEAQVEKTPHAVALRYEAETVSYDRFNRKANQIAHHLLAQGVGSGQVVAVLADRNPDFIAAVLAIFKIGAAYLPLDPNHPVDRLQTILEQSGTAFLITSEPYQRLGQSASIGLNARLLDLKDLAEVPGAEHNPGLRVDTQSLAYVIFTSGSTGKPKGAMIAHDGMLNHMSAKIKDLKMGPDTLVSQDAAQTFDISVWQFLAALLVGGSVQIFPDEVARLPVRLMDEVARTGCTVLEVVPSFLGVMLEEIRYRQGQRPDFSALKILLSSGETLSPAMARQWFDCFPEIPVLNMWGATECSDDVTHGLLTAPPGLDVVNLSVGKPILNMKIYLLDPQGLPVPVGVAGEIYVGGVGVGLGYLNNPEATAKAFVHHTFPQLGRMRLYKTGDLGRYLADGNIEFIGRTDFQVKIHGYRIELGEIEAALNKLSEVAEALVIAYSDAADKDKKDARLVAYVKPRGEGLEEAWLRTQLLASLPEYMVPANFVVLNEFPLTVNGKVDRKALPVPEQAPVTAQEIVAPRTETEALLAKYWMELLKLETVGVYHNFFALGGHSLLATQVISRVKDGLGIQLPIRALFESPTIAGLAERIDTLKAIIQTPVAEAHSTEREEFEI